MSSRASAYIKQLVVCPNGERLTKTEKLVALCLADSHQDKSATYTYPAVATLAEESLMDERSCRRLLAELARKGVIEIFRPVIQGRGVYNCYRFPVLDAPGKGGHSVPLSAAKRGVERRAEGGQKPPPYKEEQEQEQRPEQNPLLSPMLRTGDGGLRTPSDRIEDSPQVHAVMQACGFSQRRLRRVIGAQLQLELDRGWPPGQVSLRLIAAWKEFRVSAPLLRYDWGAGKFFGEGYWRNSDTWPWSERALEEQRLRASASVGVPR